MSAAGLILAGGEGRRWGGPKAWAQLPDGRSFLEACVAALVAAGVGPVVATVPPGTDAAECGGARLIPLPGGGLDMFASARHGLAVVLGDPAVEAVVILPVDHPLIRPETVAALVAAGPPAALPSLAGRHGHPLCLGREAAQAVVDGRLAGPTLREVVRAVGAHDLPVTDPGVRANCNTPAALAAALAAYSGEAPSPSGKREPQ